MYHVDLSYDNKTLNIKILKTTVIVLIVFAFPCLGFSQTASAPDSNQQAADQAECQQHAMAMSGYNPADPQATTSAPPPERGAGLRGAARGAARGAVAGEAVERVGDEGEHEDAAEVGAAVGAVRGGSRARRDAKQEAQSTPPPAGDSSAYTKSYNDCMVSRGYQVQ